MSSTMRADVCRITVIGPDKRVDLAVPRTTTVATLMPVLLQHAGPVAGEETAPAEGAWVLQRLGDSPFDPGGTPESLDWLEGERLHLRQVEDELPELDFDDLAEGIATSVNRRGDRWRPEYRRQLFLGLSAVALVVLAVVILQNSPDLLAGIAGLSGAGGLLLASVLIARGPGDRALSLLFGLGAAGYAGATAANLADGVTGGLDPNRTAVVVGATAAIGVVAALAICQRVWAPALPYPPFLVVLVVALAAVIELGLRNRFGMSAPGAAAIVATALFGLVVYSPKMVLRMAGLRGPQLPKTGEELQYDTEPAPADDVRRRTARADNYLSIIVVGTSLILPVLNHTMMSRTGWAGWTMVIILSSAVLLRARAFLGVWQRVALTATGGAGFIMVVLRAAESATPGWWIVLVVGLTLLAAVLVMAARRPWPRRLLPIWEFLATVLDLVTGLAILPLALQLLGAYSWARGLLG